MWIVNKAKYFFALSGLLVLTAIIGISVYGFSFGVDFTGGSLASVSYSDKVPSVEQINTSLTATDLGGFSARAAGDNGYVIRLRDLSPEDRVTLENALTIDGSYEYTIDQLSTVGPSVGAELRTKAYIALAIVLFAIVLFIIFAFRKVSKPVPSWKYGMATITALAHDILVPAGFFAFMGHFYGFEVDMLFVAALLAIMGYSVHDTIVVFDRVRERLVHNHTYNNKEGFADTVGYGLNETIARSINTSLTTVLVLIALYVFGGEATRNFVLVLIVGIVAGTYSSIFLASPLLVAFKKWQDR